MSEMAEEWKQKLENTNQRRKDTDRLVMNYLLAGERFVAFLNKRRPA
jgi:hypothetical protein